VLVVAAAIVTYANGLDGTFTYDDKAIIRENARIRSPRTVRQLFTTHYFGGPRGTGSNYRPVLLLSFAVQWWIHGRDAVAFHVVNLVLHVAATLMLARLFLRVGLPPPAVGASALLFAVHPIHVEAVTSLVGRGETLSAVLVLAYLLAALSVFERRRRALALAGTTVLFALAFLTKETSVAAPGAAVLLFLFATPGTAAERWRACLSRSWPALAVTAASLVGVMALRRWFFGGWLKAPGTGFFEVENILAPLSPLGRAGNACVLFFRYLGRMVLPLRLSADESAWSIRPLPLSSPIVIAAVLLVVLVGIAAIARFFRGSALAFAFLWMAVWLLPTSNLLFPIGTHFAERLAYLPSAGVTLAAGLLLSRPGREPASRPLAIGTLTVIAVLLSMRTVARNAVWWSDRGLFANLVATSPASAKAHYNLGWVHAFFQEWPAGLAEYTRATEIYDGYWDAWAGRGRMEKELGRYDEAIRCYEKSIALFPGYENGYFGLGAVHEARGDDASAARTYRRGLVDNPRSLPLALRLAVSESRLRSPATAACWDRALELGPSVGSVRAEHARWLLDTGRTAEARREAREAWRRNPALPEALRVLAEADARDGMRLGESLARERLWKVTGKDEDREAWERTRPR
jgi:tetratricopeptide (TPR) repeat protein